MTETNKIEETSQISNTISPYIISDELDTESNNINGIADLLFCMGNSVTEISSEAMYVLGNCLFDIHERLNVLSKAIMEYRENKV